MKTFAEQLAALKATREQKQAALKAVAQKSVDEGRSMDTAEAEQFDTLQGEIKRLDDDIARLSTLAEMDKQTATPVDEVKSAAPVTQGSVGVQVKSVEKLDPGIGFARVARVKAVSQLNHASALQVAQTLYPKDTVLHESFAKTAVPAASTGSATWAGNLVLDGGAYFADFVEHLRKRTVLGQISGLLRNIPFNTNILVQDTGGTATWVAEGAGKPLTSWTYSKTKLDMFKVAAIAAATRETLDRASTAADALIRDELTNAVGATIDSTFVGNAGAGTGNPAGIRYNISGLSGMSATGDVDDIRCDIAVFLKAMVANNLSTAGCFWVMPETTAIDLSMATNAVGAAAFPGVTPTGGTLAGLPVYTSQYMPVASAGATVMLLRGSDIFLADEGGIDVRMSDQASLLMADDASAMDSPTGAGSASLVSMFQTNSVAFLVERHINFARRRAAAVAWANVDWSACS